MGLVTKGLNLLDGATEVWFEAEEGSGGSFMNMVLGSFRFYEELGSGSYIPGDMSPEWLCFGFPNSGRGGKVRLQLVDLHVWHLTPPSSR